MDRRVLVIVVLLAGLFFPGCTPYPNLQVWIRTLPELPEGPAPFWVHFYAQVGFAGGEIVGVEWDFGDGYRGRGSEVLHIYETSGTYIATVTITHDSGATASKTKMVKVDPPALQILNHRYWIESDPYHRVVKVEGQAKNVSTRKLLPASILVKVYDIDGGLIGKAHVKRSDYLEPNEVWTFLIRCDVGQLGEIARVEVAPGQCYYGN